MIAFGKPSRKPDFESDCDMVTASAQTMSLLRPSRLVILATFEAGDAFSVVSPCKDVWNKRSTLSGLWLHPGVRTRVHVEARRRDHVDVLPYPQRCPTMKAKDRPFVVVFVPSTSFLLDHGESGSDGGDVD